MIKTIVVVGVAVLAGYGAASQAKQTMPQLIRDLGVQNDRDSATAREIGLTGEDRAGSPRAPAGALDKRNRMKIYVIGDSISMQYGPYLQEYLKGVMDYARKTAEEAALLDLDKAQGANGGDSSMVLSYLEGKARSGGIDADLLLVNCGLHDIKTDPVTGAKQVNLDQYKDNLRAIVETAASLRPKLIWIRTTPCDDAVHNQAARGIYRFSADVDAYNQAADRIMKEAGVPSIDLHTFTRNLGTDLYCDHVHFREDVREKQAAFIAGWLMAFTQNEPAQP